MRLFATLLFVLLSAAQASAAPCFDWREGDFWKSATVADVETNDQSVTAPSPSRMHHMGEPHSCLPQRFTVVRILPCLALRCPEAVARIWAQIRHH